MHYFARENPYLKKKTGRFKNVTFSNSNDRTWFSETVVPKKLAHGSSKIRATFEPNAYPKAFLNVYRAKLESCNDTNLNIFGVIFNDFNRLDHCLFF